MFEIHPLSGKEKKMSAESSLSTHKVSRIYSESLTIKNVKSYFFLNESCNSKGVILNEIWKMRFSSNTYNNSNNCK